MSSGPAAPEASSAGAGAPTTAMPVPGHTAVGSYASGPVAAGPAAAGPSGTGPARSLRARLVLVGRFLLLAVRLLRRNRRRSLLTLSSLIFTQIVVILSFSLTEAAVRMQVDQVCRKSSGHIQIMAPGALQAAEAGRPLTSPVPFAQLAAISPEVVEERPRATFFGMLDAGGHRHLVSGRGIDPARDFRSRIVSGEPLPPEARPFAPYEITLGRLAAESLKVTPGDLVLLTYLRPDGVLDDVQCRIRGLADEGSPEADRRLVAVHIDTVRKLLGLGAGCHQQVLFLRDPTQVDQVVRKLQTALGAGYDVLPWSAFNPQLRRISHLTRASMLLLVGIIVLISLFGIAGVLGMSVAERAREFGLFAAMGMFPSEMVLCVVLEALLLGTVTFVAAGILAYALLALLSVHGFNFTFLIGEAVILDGVRLDMVLYPQPRALHFVAAFVLVWGTSLLASLWPAWRASRQDPLEAMAFHG